MNSDSKEYPTNYPADAVAILDSMSMTDGKGVELVGSMSLRSQQYAGDYDANDFVKLDYASEKEALDHCATAFKEAVRRTLRIPNTYIGDIKCGEVGEWRVFSEETRVHNGEVVHYNAETSRSKIRQLRKDQIITPTDEKDALALIHDHPTPIQLVKAKDGIKFHIVRWTVAEVLEGEKRLKDGRTFTLQDGFSSRSITKLDVFGWIQNNRYTEFAMIYFAFNKGKALNPTVFDYEDSLKESILYYASEGMYFKVLKRQFSLAKFKDDKKKMDELTEIFNSDLGRLYHIVSDIRTLVKMLDEQSKLRIGDIKFEIDQFKGRMANIYALEPFLKDEHTFLGYINSALKTTSTKQLRATLTKMDDVMSELLGKASQKYSGGKIDRDTLDKNFAFPNPKYPQGANLFVADVLGNAYHYLQNRSAVERAASLGLRQLANDILDANYEKNKSGMDRIERSKFEYKRASHQKAIDIQEAKLLEQTPTIAEFYDSSLKSLMTKIAKLYDGNYRLVKKFVEDNPDIKINKKGVESRAVEWALRNKAQLKMGKNPYWEDQPTLDRLESGEEPAIKTVRAKTEARATEKLGSFVSILKPKATASVAEKKRIEEEKKKAEEAERKRKAEQSARDRERIAEQKKIADELAKKKRAEQSAKDRLKAAEEKKIKEEERLAKEKADAEAKAAIAKAKSKAKVSKAKATVDARDADLDVLELFGRESELERQTIAEKEEARRQNFMYLLREQLHDIIGQNIDYAKKSNDTAALKLMNDTFTSDKPVDRGRLRGFLERVMEATNNVYKASFPGERFDLSIPAKEFEAIAKEEYTSLTKSEGLINSIGSFLSSMMGTK